MSICHDCVVFQRIAYRNVSVISHGCQNEDSPACINVNKESLSDTWGIVQGSGFGQELLDDLQEERWGAYQVVDWEVEQNQIHGLMQRFVQNDDRDENEVAEDDDHVAQGGK